MAPHLQTLTLSVILIVLFALISGTRIRAFVKLTEIERTAKARPAVLQSDQIGDNHEQENSFDKAPQAVRAATIKQAGGVNIITTVTCESYGQVMVQKIEYMAGDSGGERPGIRCRRLHEGSDNRSDCGHQLH